MSKASPGRLGPVSRAITAFLIGILILVLLMFSAEGLYRQLLRSRANSTANTGEFELYGVGESSMRGMPFGKSPPDVVGELFAGTLAGRPLRVLNLAEGGNSIYPQAVKAVRTLRYRNKNNPAVVLIYAGHDELMRMGPPSPRYLRLYEAFKERALSHSLLFSKVVLDAETRLSFHGVRDLAHYEFYLRSIIEAAFEAGAVPVISTLQGNMSCAEPNGAEFSPELAEAVGLELRGKYADALGRYNGLLKTMPPGKEIYLRPYLEYRVGRCLQADRKPAAAREYLLDALETDPVQFRAKPSQNALIRKLAREYSIPLVDAEKTFAQHSPDGLPGSDLFVDLMHPDTPGYLLLARGFAEKLEDLLHDRIRSDIRDSSVFFAPPFTNLSRNGVPFGRTEAYTLAGTYLLWFATGTAPMPDHLKLAEKDFDRAISASPHNTLAKTGLRVVKIAQKNAQSMPQEVNAWFRSMRPVFERLQPLTKEEQAEADAFLRKWEDKRAN